MLFADNVYASLVEPLDLCAIRALQGCKRADVALLQLIKGVRRQTIQDNVISKRPSIT